MTDEAGFGPTDQEIAERVSPWRPDLMAGQTVVVTGGSGGLGRVMAFQFARLGAKVALAGRDPHKLQAAVDLIAAHGGQAMAGVCNIREPDDVAAFMTRAADELGPLDVLINSAGGQYPQAAIDFSSKGWKAVIDTNLNGTWHMMQAAARGWRDAGRPGAIVNIVLTVDRGMPGVAHSTAARAGVIGLSKTVAVEWAEHGIRVNCIAPGPILTEGMRVYPPETFARIPRMNPMMRFGDPWDIADAAVYLSTPASKFVTGETLTVDGGATLGGEFWLIEKPEHFG